MTTVEALINKYDNGLGCAAQTAYQNLVWKGSLDTISFEPTAIKNKLLSLDKACYIVKVANNIGVTNDGYLAPAEIGTTGQVELLTSLNPIKIQQLGDPSFLSFYGVQSAYMTGAMAGGIASEEMVIALGKEKILGSFGAGGLPPERLEAAINRIQQALPHSP